MTRRLLIGFALCVLSLHTTVNSCYAQNVYAKIADEWATLYTEGFGGPRSSTGGNRFWNIDGGPDSFFSTGTLRFYMNDLVPQLDSDFPGGWQVDNVTLVAEQSNAGFTTNGLVNVYHLTNDTIGFTNGEDADGDPGDFGDLPQSPLFYDEIVPGVLTGGGDLGTVTLVNSYDFIEVSDGTLDVLGTTNDPVDPTLATTVSPDYGVFLPSDAADSLSEFNSRLSAVNGGWEAGALDLLAEDIESGTEHYR